MIPFDVRFVDPSKDQVAWPELDEEAMLQSGKLRFGRLQGAATIEGGTKEGRPSVIVRIDLVDGQVVMAQTSARLFCLAAKMIMERYPELFDGH